MATYEKYLEFTGVDGTVYKGRIIIDGVSAGLDATGAPADQGFMPIEISTAPNYTVKAKDVPFGRAIWPSRTDLELGVRRGVLIDDPVILEAYKLKWPHVLCGVGKPIM